jgi:RNA polymerase sigma factor (sigma-70 family)
MTQKEFIYAYKHYHPAVSGYLRLFITNKEECDDIASECFAKVYERLKDVDFKRIRQYLHVLAYNSMIDLKRKDKYKAQYLLRTSPSPQQTAQQDPITLLSAGMEDPEAIENLQELLAENVLNNIPATKTDSPQIISNLDLKTTLKALENFPKDEMSQQQRDMIVLVANGVSYRDLAKRFGIKEDTVKSRLHCGRKKLKKILKLI